MKSNQVNILALPMLRDFEQIDHSEEPGLSRQRWSDIYETDLFDRIHFDLAFVHSVSRTDFNVGALPDSNAAGNLSAPDPFAQTLCEHHCGYARKAVVTYRT